MPHRRKPGNPPRPPKSFTTDHGVTPREWDALVAYAIYGNQKEAAEFIGASVQTFKNHLTSARKRLQSHHIFDAYQAIGWLVVPDQPEQPVGDLPDALTIHGHRFVHVAACPCLRIQAEVARLDAQPPIDWASHDD